MALIKNTSPPRIFLVMFRWNIFEILCQASFGNGLANYISEAFRPSLTWPKAVAIITTRDNHVSLHFRFAADIVIFKAETIIKMALMHPETATIIPALWRTVKGCRYEMTILFGNLTCCRNPQTPEMLNHVTSQSSDICGKLYLFSYKLWYLPDQKTTRG